MISSSALKITWLSIGPNLNCSNRCCFKLCINFLPKLQSLYICTIMLLSLVSGIIREVVSQREASFTALSRQQTGIKLVSYIYHSFIHTFLTYCTFLLLLRYSFLWKFFPACIKLTDIPSYRMVPKSYVHLASFSKAPQASNDTIFWIRINSLVTDHYAFCFLK